MKAQCPHCKTIQEAPDDATGKRARCKSCRDTFVIINEYEERVVPDIDPSTLPTKTRRANFFTRVWSGIPGPFKTAFLATLGVVSALLFAWYVVRVPNWFTRPPTVPATAGRPLTAGDPESAKLLTELLHCCEYFSGLDTIQTLRTAFSTSNNPVGMLYSGKPNIDVITQAVLVIDKRPLCTDAGMRLLTSQIRDAFQAELRCHQFMADVADGISPPKVSTAKALVAEAVRRTEIAYETLLLQTARFGVFE